MTQDVTGEETDAAREDLWLTYQNYDPAVKQAVRRLGALPGNNVEEFRSLFLASRQRSRVKEFESDVVRRLQGEAFVDDEVLQQTLIVLHAENPQLAEQFKQFVAANGRPEDIDLTVARLRSGTDNPVMLERMPRQPRETPVMSQLITPERIDAEMAPGPVAEIPAPEIPAPVAPKPPAPPSAAPVEEKRQAPVFVASPPLAAPANDTHPDEAASRASWTKRVVAVAAVLLIGAAGFFVLMPKFANTQKPAAFQATTAPLRRVAADEKAPAQPAPVVTPAPVSELAPNPPTQTAPEQAESAQPGAESLQAGPATAQARNDIQPPAPQTPAPPSAQETIVPPSAANAADGPVPGATYKVVRGDRLSVIARKAYGNASLYPIIQQANPGVRNADIIYSDQVITLPPRP